MKRDYPLFRRVSRIASRSVISYKSSKFSWACLYPCEYLCQTWFIFFN